MKPIAISSFLTLCVALAAGSARAGEATIRLEDAPGRELTAARCAVCHSLDYIQMNAAVMDRTGWEKSIRKMIDRFGAPISAEDSREILEYLAKHYSS